MKQLSRKDLQFCFDELLGELGWCDEIEDTGVDPLDFARDEIKSLQRHARRVNRPLVSQDALYLASAWDTIVENNYLTQEFIDNHMGVISAATLASKTLHQMAASESDRAAEHRVQADVLARCAKCNALIETTVHCDNCGTFEPTRS